SVRALLICRVAPGSSVVKSTFWFASARLPRSLTMAVIVAAELPAESRSLVSDSSVSDCAWLPPRSPPPPAPAPEPPQAARVRNISRAVSQAAIDRGLWPAVVVVMVAIRVWGGSPRLARECRIRDHPWRDEHEQFGPVVGPGIVLEGVADDREVAEERHLVGLVAFDLLVDAADHHRAAVLHQHLGLHPAGVDREAGGGLDADRVAVDLHLEDHVAFRSDLRGHLELQVGLAEGHRRGAARSRLLVGQLGALLDDRLALVGRQHAGRR